MFVGFGITFRKVQLSRSVVGWFLFGWLAYAFPSSSLPFVLNCMVYLSLRCTISKCFLYSLNFPIKKSPERALAFAQLVRP